MKQSAIHFLISVIFRNFPMSMEERRSENTTPNAPDLLESAALSKVEVKSEDEECDKISALFKFEVKNEDEHCKKISSGFVCPRCQAHFIHVDMFMEHVKQYHEQPKCDKVQSAITIEINEKSNTGDGPHKCGMRSKSFTRKWSLTLHKISTHTGEKPYKCWICSQAFSHKSSLNYHMKTHSGDKPYKCGICSRAFIQKSGLTVHMRTHTGEKSYKCETCSRAFIHNSALTQHMRTHTCERP